MFTVGKENDIRQQPKCIVLIHTLDQLDDIIVGGTSYLILQIREEDLASLGIYGNSGEDGIREAPVFNSILLGGGSCLVSPPSHPQAPNTAAIIGCSLPHPGPHDQDPSMILSSARYFQYHLSEYGSIRRGQDRGYCIKQG